MKNRQFAMTQNKTKFRNTDIRHADLEDIDTLVSLEQYFPTDRLTHERFVYLLKHGNCEIVVYEVKEKIVGNTIVLFRKGSKVARLYSLVVEPKYQGHGVAHMLIDAAIQDALKKRCNVLSLEVREDNKGAQSLYAEFGFEPVDKLDNFYDDGKAAIKLVKKI